MKHPKVHTASMKLRVDDPYYETIVSRHEAFFACETIQQQVQELQNILRNRSERPGAILLQFLSTVYLAAYSPQSAALRRISFGALRELSSADVSPALHSRLGILMERSAVAEDADPCAHLDELSLLAAWHPHGVEALCADLPRVLAYLAAALRHVKPLSQLSSQERERASNYSSKVARCVAVLSKTNPGTETNKLILRDIHSNIWQLLIDESTTLSCRLSCGVSLPELSRAVDSPRGSGCGARTMLTAHHYELAAVPLAYVCFLSGMINITRLDDDEELQVFEDLLIDLDQLSSRQELQQEAPFALTCVRTVLQWTEKLAEDDQRSTRRLFERRLEDLLRIASMNIEHFVDAVQHQGKALFKTIITYLVKHFGQKYINFLQRTFKQLLGEAHYKKAKYAPLQTIAKHIEIQSMVDAAVVTEVYQALREKSMFPYVEDFLRDVGGKYRAENPAGFTEVWVRPFFAVFESGQCAPTVEGLLPVLLRLQPGLADEILSRSIDQRTYLLLALKALSPGQLFERPEILQHAQWTTDESVQHSLLRLLTECPKSCEPISPRLMPHVVLFLELNISTQSQALKQAMFSSFKKLLQRVADSDVYWRKPGKTHEIYGEKGMEDVLRQQRELVTSMWDFCLSQLHPGCSFFTRSTALMLLELLVPLANAKRWTQANVNTLLYWMKDTYESNKTAVTNILAKAPRQLLPFAQSEEAFDEWLKRSISLTRSARPPDGVTAAYILRLLAKIGQVQMRHETSESPRDTGGGTSFLPNGRFAQLFGAILPELRTQVEVALNRGLLEASSAAPMYSVLLCVRMLLNEALAGSLGPEHAETYRSVLREVLDLAYKISTVASSLVTNQSPEGRMELDEHPELVEQFKAALNKGFGKRLGECERLLQEYEPFSAFLPQRHRFCGASNMTMLKRMLKNADAVKTSAVAAQMLLLCCWRSHREVSLCFGDISAHLNKITALKILPDDEFVKMGVYFMDELCKVRHRGAFEQASTGFARLCSSLWRSPEERLRQLPTEWLEELMTRVASGEVSATRRSAGLPFVVQSIVMTEPEVNGNQGLKQAMGGLLPLAAGKDEQARVHALNVLRTLYRDTRLGKSVMCYVSAGMRSALEGFSHPAWRVRNASTLLFSALMMRIFGVNRSRQDIERKNCLTGNVFFQRFPELLPFLLERIADLVCRINDHAGLYPILLLLGRLVPSLADSKLGRFMHLLDFCAGSPLHGVRVASSRAYGALLSAETRIRVLPEKMRSLASMKGNVGGNLMHGILLQIRTVLEMSGLSEELVASLREPLREGCWIATSQYAIASAEYVHLLTVCNVKLDEVLKIVPVTDELIPGGDHFEAAITKYKLTFGVPADARTDSEKMATLEFHLDQNPTSPVELMQRVLQDPSKEHPDVQRMAYELATRVADELDKPRERVDHLLDRLFQVSYPSVAVALFGLVAALVTRIAPSSLHGAIEALRRYSATNQDPGMRRVAADLAYNVLAAHGRAVLTSNPASHIALAEGLVNLVLDNDVHVRNRIVDGVATITANELCARTPLEAVLALCSETSPAPQEFGQFLVDLAAADGDAALAWLNNDQNYDPAEGNLDEQPFEKGELNTFYDALVVAESCRRALEHLRPRLTGRLSMPKLSIAQEAALDELEEQIRHVSDCELASNRQLDAGLVLLGQRLTARAMVKDRLQISERPLVNNVYFVRFAQLGN